MRKLGVTKDHYYQERYENNGYIITEGPTTGYLIWKDHEVVKAVRTLLEAEEFTTNN
jgi:hypothetical protein